MPGPLLLHICGPKYTWFSQLAGHTATSRKVILGKGAGLITKFNVLMERCGTMVRTAVSQLREPVFKSCAAFSSFVCIYLFCYMNKYLAIDSGGYVCKNNFHASIAV